MAGVNLSSVCLLELRKWRFGKNLYDAATEMEAKCITQGRSATVIGLGKYHDLSALTNHEADSFGTQAKTMGYL